MDRRRISCGSSASSPLAALSGLFASAIAPDDGSSAEALHALQCPLERPQSDAPLVHVLWGA